MKSLIQYLFEALVNGSELEKNLKFEETDIDEILDILDSDEYNHFVELAGSRYDKDTVRNGVFLLNISTHFKIMYEGTLLGIFSVCLPENFNDLMKKHKDDSPDIESDYRNLITLFWPFVRGYAALEKYDLLDKNDYKEIIEDFLEKSEEFLEIEKKYDADIQKCKNEYAEYSQKEKLEKLKRDNYKKLEPQIRASVKELVNRIMRITGFVVIWQLSKDAKKKLDVNQVSLLKIFFQKLTELIKNSGAKYIMAQGKDEHVTKAYVKLGGFKSADEFYKNNTTEYFYKMYSDTLDGTVIKRI